MCNLSYLLNCIQESNTVFDWSELKAVGVICDFSIMGTSQHPQFKAHLLGVDSALTYMQTLNNAH